MGKRYKSLTKNNYDLCEKCRFNGANANLAFIQIPYDAMNENIFMDSNAYQVVVNAFYGKIRSS